MRSISQPFILNLLLALSLITLGGCDNLESKSDSDTFTELDDIGQTSASNELVVIENQFGNRIAMELWLGDEIEYNILDGKVYAKNLTKLAPNSIKVDSQSSTSINLTQSKDVLAVVGVRISEDGVTPEVFEYLTQEKLMNIVNGSGIRLSENATLTAFSSSQCLTGLTTDQSNQTLSLSNVLINNANAVATQWKPIKEITNPLNTLLKFVKAVINEDQDLQLQFLTDLSLWSVSNGVFTHTETVNASTLTLVSRFLWGGIGGHAATDPITDDLQNPANYFTGLSAQLDSTDIIFTYQSTGPLAPLIGLPVDANPGTYEISVTSWVKDILNVYKSLLWDINLNVNHDNAGDKLNADLNYVGRPSFNINLDLNVSKPSLSVSQNPFSLTLKAATGSRVSRNQSIDVSNWNLKVFPDDNGGKGVIEFAIKGDQNFDYDGSIAYNSDTNTAANSFLQCSIDKSPLVF